MRRSSRALQQLGWAVGRNVQIDYRWAAGDADRIRKYAAELVALAPDVILAAGTSTVAPLQQATRTVPIVFVNVTDPVGAGFVESLARPGGNATGFTNFEYSMSGKWLELLKQIAPRERAWRCFVIPRRPAGLGQFGAIQAVAQSLGVELTPVGVRDADEIERGVAAFRAFREWRPDRDVGRVGVSSRSHHRACGPARAARGLPFRYLRR